jgi:enoyl-CoA hydratase/carnithine racemase
VKTLEADDAIGCPVATGAGDKAFSAGGDIKEQVEDDKRHTRKGQDRMAIHGAPTVRVREELSKLCNQPERS